MLNIIRILLLALMVVSSANAVIEQQDFERPEMAVRYQALINELRCLVCQNQNIADSDADLAKDLRVKTADMLRAGKSDAQVRDFMRERYGDFVLYAPPFNASTAVLWLGPLVVLLVVIIGVVVHLKRRPTSALDAEQQRQLRALLDDAQHQEDSP